MPEPVGMKTDKHPKPFRVWPEIRVFHRSSAPELIELRAEVVRELAPILSANNT